VFITQSGEKKTFSREGISTGHPRRIEESDSRVEKPPTHDSDINAEKLESEQIRHRADIIIDLTRRLDESHLIAQNAKDNLLLYLVEMAL
jgi:hypothetical protein